MVPRLREVPLTHPSFQGLSFRHHTTSSWPVEDSQFPGSASMAGTTVWVAMLPDPRSGEVAAIAWDWALVLPGVVAVADLCAMVSNVRLVDAHGHPMSQQAHVIALVSCVHGLDWQATVLKEIEREFGPAPRALPTSPFTAAGSVAPDEAPVARGAQGSLDPPPRDAPSLA